MRSGRQRGVFQLGALAALPWVAIAKWVAIGLALWAGYQYFDNTWETDAGITRGKRETVDQYRERDRQADEKFEREKKALAEKNAKLEAALAAKNEAIGKEYQKGLDDGKKELADSRARIAARGGMRDPGARPSAGATCPTMPATGSSGPSVASTPGAELSAPDRGVLLSDVSQQFLTGIGSEADDAVKQLRGVQDALEACYAAMEKAAR